MGTAIALASLALTRSSRADEPAPAAAVPAVPADAPLTPPVPLRHDLWIDIPATLALGGGVVVYSAFRNDLLPHHCRLCDGSGPGDVNAIDDFFRSALHRSDTTPADTASNVIAYGVAPLAAVGLGAAVAAADKRIDEVPLNTLLVAEATVTSLALTEGLKSLFLRERPYAHFETDPEKHQALLANGESVVSFPSGHTGTTFALAAAAGTVATMRGYRLAPLVWITGAVLAATTGYLRMAADRHYFTDVVTGAALGTGVGIGVPLLFHRPSAGSAPTLTRRLLYNTNISSAPVPGGRVVSFGWTL